MTVETNSKVNFTEKKIRGSGLKGVAAGAAALLVAAACSGSAKPPEATASAGVSASASPEVTATAGATAAATATAEVCKPVANSALQDSRRFKNFDGSRHLSSTLVATSITLQGHDCYDRIIIGLTGSKVNRDSDLPGIAVSYAKGPFTNNAEQPVTVQGNAFMRLDLGTTIQPAAAVYDDPSLHLVREGKVADNFEGYSTLIFGVDATREFTLTEQAGGIGDCPPAAARCEVIDVQKVS